MDWPAVRVLVVRDFGIVSLTWRQYGVHTAYILGIIHLTGLANTSMEPLQSPRRQCYGDWRVGCLLRTPLYGVLEVEYLPRQQSLRLPHPGRAGIRLFPVEPRGVRGGAVGCWLLLCLSQTLRLSSPRLTVKVVLRSAPYSWPQARYAACRRTLHRLLLSWSQKNNSKSGKVTVIIFIFSFFCQHPSTLHPLPLPLPLSLSSPPPVSSQTNTSISIPFHFHFHFHFHVCVHVHHQIHVHVHQALFPTPFTHARSSFVVIYLAAKGCCL
jgi:hypothetical protein